ncbi:sugar transferase [Solwaraspora sp. WMMB335]|uniref:sugar transferase n=1 Tax=Solwaraspora sp. WMMB335 TaxID=3404118 RepID=UPI003B948141
MEPGSDPPAVGGRPATDPARPPAAVRRSAVRRYDAVKRVLDLTGAAVGLLVAAPVLASVALLVLIALGRPVLFRQVRPGRDGELFEMIKFRTMLPVDPGRHLVTDAERMTRVGRWLRATSLDELPELFNVLRGQMSLVGPRPYLVKYLDLYTPWQSRRHEVRPGITGLAQVRGRNDLSWEDKLAYDVAYVDNRSLRLDLRILTETVRAVLRRDGITVPGTVSAAEFTGAPVTIRADPTAVGSDRS